MGCIGSIGLVLEWVKLTGDGGKAYRGEVYLEAAEGLRELRVRSPSYDDRWFALDW